jgi:hypothetical protein
MSGLTKEFLAEMDVEMDDQTFQAFSEHFDDELHDHIIDRIIHQLTPAQVTELTSMKGVAPDIIWEWLQNTVPNHKDLVKQEVDAMLAEVVRNSDHL